jgi:hypothetical protein
MGARWEGRQSKAFRVNSFATRMTPMTQIVPWTSQAPRAGPLEQLCYTVGLATLPMV